MDIKVINNIAVVNGNGIVIKDAASAIDCVMEIKRKANCNKIVLNKTAIIEDFFVLSSGLAGEILQKFVNYGIKFAIYGVFAITADEAKEMLSQ